MKKTYVTHVDHSIKIKLGLTNDEYIMMDFLASIKHIATFKDYKEAIGFSREATYAHLVSLRQKELITRDSTGKIITADRWRDAFKTPDRIDEIWSLHPAGSKQKARTRLPYVLKKISMEDLKERLVAYLKWCEETDTFIKNMDTWLNPKEEHWNSQLIPRKKKLPFGYQEPVKDKLTYIVK